MRQLTPFITRLISIAVTLFVASAPAPTSPRHADIATGLRIHLERKVYYGDLHLFTTYSFSAYLAGVRVSPDDAYRFARGEAVIYQGEKIRRTSPPLDFLAVTDQAENLGLLNTLDDPDSPFSKSEIGQSIRRRDPNIAARIIDLMLISRSNPRLGMEPAIVKAASQAAWQEEIEAANSHYQPGTFTTFIGFHWTSHPGGKNLHRNVIFRGNEAPLPFSSIDSIRPEDLWAYLDHSGQSGREALAIPHNSNLSQGLMFSEVDSDGAPISADYGRRRVAHEPLVEIANLGESETLPVLSPEDEFSHFELFGMEGMRQPAGSYLRDALGRGLEIAAHTGINPFKFGFVASTDYSNGLSDSAESAYGGANGAFDATKPPPKADPAGTPLPEHEAHPPGSGSLTGVWAEQNSRESIFAAFRRRETFGTSGTRLKLRFFAGWHYGSRLFSRRDWVKDAYLHGVPMGADLPPGPAMQKVPTFVIWASKDPQGANLDRIQVIRIRLEKGKTVERIYDVVLSGDRHVDPKTGKAAAVGNTVDLRTANYTNTIGAPELSIIWLDPDFNPREPAVYYIRALEIPTPRWSTIAAIKRGEPLPPDVPPTIQERGWSSPIWYGAPAQTRKGNGESVLQ